MNANDLAVCVVNNRNDVKPLKWFTFDQNNSGGRFVVNDKVAPYVIIQAHNADEANELAENIGIYFNGVDEGFDCECCGDRWCRTWRDGDDVPEVYGQIVEFVPGIVNNVKRNDDAYDVGRDIKVYPYGTIK